MVPPLSRRALVQALAVAAAARPPVSAPASLTGSAGRVVAVGDIHGDLHALVKLLELSGLWSEAKRKWTGGTATFVQLGDTLDRGDDEYEVLELLRELKAAATVRSSLTGSARDGNRHEMPLLHGCTELAAAATVDTTPHMRMPEGWRWACHHDAGKPRGHERDGRGDALHLTSIQGIW